MKATVFLTAVVLFLVAAGTTVGVEEGASFKPKWGPDEWGIKWGTDIRTLKGMTRIGTDPSYGGIDLYTKKNDHLRMGGARLSKVVYYFWRKRLMETRMSANGSANCAALKKATSKKFGEGVKPLFSDSYRWAAPRASIEYIYDEANRSCLLLTTSGFPREETYIGTDKDNQRWSIDTESIVRLSEDTVEVETQTRRRHDDVIGVNDINWEFNCATRESRIQRLAAIWDPSYTRKDKGWKPVVAGSIEEAIYNYVCPEKGKK